MSNQNPTDPEAIAQIREELNKFARLLREGELRGADAQKTMANLLEELGAQLDPSAKPSEQTIHLAGLVSQFARSLHEQQHANVLTSARNRLVEATHWAETHGPAATDIVTRFIDVLASIGI